MPPVDPVVADVAEPIKSLCAFVVVGSGSQKTGNVGSQGGQGVQVGIVSLV